MLQTLSIKKTVKAVRPFAQAQWIWPAKRSDNSYVAFTKTLPTSSQGKVIEIRISARYNYELFINGKFISRGPCHGDPAWCIYDTIEYKPSDNQPLDITIIAHHSKNVYLHYQIPGPAGLIAEFQYPGGERFGTDTSWPCLNLKMWNQDVPPRGLPLGYIEDYDAAIEPTHWASKRFPIEQTANWPSAEIVEKEFSPTDYTQRILPPITRRFIAPRSVIAWKADSQTPDDLSRLSEHCDNEELLPIGTPSAFHADIINAQLASGDVNAFTLDLGAEYVGFIEFEIDAPGGVTIDISTAERLQPNAQRPWIHRKFVSYTWKYKTKPGRQTFTSFAWTGLRYLHIVIRSNRRTIAINKIGCISRSGIHELPSQKSDNPDLNRIFEICTHTLSICTQEHLIDCPTREQTQYWGDGLFISELLAQQTNSVSYLRWYLECFLHVPFKQDGQISSTYPGAHRTMADYSLIPTLGQNVYKKYTGEFYHPQEFFHKARRLDAWYVQRTNSQGLVELPTFEDTIAFIDHPGLGLHDFPHPGIDRTPVSAGLNIFYYGFLVALRDLAVSAAPQLVEIFSTKAAQVKETILQSFFDGRVFHDALEENSVTHGTSWQVNTLAVYFDIVDKTIGKKIMQTMLDGYDSLCRCSPYFYFYMLPALCKVDMYTQAVELVIKEWKPMIAAGATTTWECFDGGTKDSLCHPWSTSPLLLYAAWSKETT